MKKKRIFALTAAILLILLYLSTLVFALMSHPIAENLLIASLFCTIVMPGVLYGYQLVLKYFKDQKPDK